MSLQEIYEEDYSLVMADLLKGYEMIEDKTDSSRWKPLPMLSS